MMRDGAAAPTYTAEVTTEAPEEAPTDPQRNAPRPGLSARSNDCRSSSNKFVLGRENSSNSLITDLEKAAVATTKPKTPIISTTFTPTANNNDANNDTANGLSRSRFIVGKANDALVDIDFNNNDDDDNYIPPEHSQLPDVESYKTELAASIQIANGNSLFLNAHDTTDKNKRRKIILVAIGFVLSSILILLFGIIISFDEKIKNNHHHSSSSNVDGNDAIQIERFNQILHMARMKWSDHGVHIKETGFSAQYDAVKWLANVDSRHVEITDEDQLRIRYALAVLYFSTHGSKWDYTSKIRFMTSHHHCQWNGSYDSAAITTATASTATGSGITVGVQCEEGGGNSDEITSLRLLTMNLDGTIPVEIGSLLTGLREIDLYNNKLHSTIPDTIYTGLPKLAKLVLHKNALTDTIPTSIRHLTNLEVLDLGRNNMNGALPVNTFSTMTNLHTISLEGNQFKGKINMVFKDCHKLKYVDVGTNKLSGPVHNTMTKTLMSVIDFDISDNKFTGTIPDDLLDLPFIQTIDLHHNLFHGTIPASAKDDHEVSYLKFLALHGNSFKGTMNPIISGKYVNLQHLDVSHNAFTGDIPEDGLKLLTNLRYLFLSYNDKLNAGTIPSSIASMEQLVDVSLQSTNRKGAIPESIGTKNTNLVLLDLNSNQLTGSIPSSVGLLTKLRFLMLRENQLIGSVPDEIVNLKKLEVLLINGNNNTLTPGISDLLCNGKNDFGSDNTLINTVLPVLSEFVADCKAPDECTCCSACCDIRMDDVDMMAEQCTDTHWFAQQDPISEYNYERTEYKFIERNIIYPVPDTEAFLEFYDLGSEQEAAASVTTNSNGNK